MAARVLCWTRSQSSRTRGANRKKDHGDQGKARHYIHLWSTVSKRHSASHPAASQERSLRSRAKFLLSLPALARSHASACADVQRACNSPPSILPVFIINPPHLARLFLTERTVPYLTCNGCERRIPLPLSPFALSLRTNCCWTCGWTCTGADRPESVVKLKQLFPPHDAF